LSFSWLSLRVFADWFAHDVAVPTARAAPDIGRRTLLNLYISLSTAAFWVKRYVALGTFATGRMLNNLRAQATRTPFRLNRFVIAVLITLIIIALGVIPSQEPQPEESFAPDRALAEQRPSPQPPTPEPRTIILPTKIPPIKATEVISETVSTPPISETLESPPGVDVIPRNIGSVVFTLRKNGNSDIYALVEGGKAPFRLTSHPADDRDPAWSPEGGRIAFSSHRDGNWEIYILDLLTTRISRITDSLAFDGKPSWSPDGRWLVYESYQYDNLDLFIVDASGNDVPIRLTEHETDDYSPVWGPGGRHVAFTSRRDGDPDIFILTLEATADEIAINITNTPNKSEDHPAFDSTGNNIAYETAEAGFDLTYVQPLANYRSKGEPVLIRQGSHPAWSGTDGELIFIHRQDSRAFIVGGSVNPWNANSQAFATDDWIDDLSWSPNKLPDNLDLTRHPEGGIPLFSEFKSPIRREGAPYLIWPVDVDAPSAYLSDRVDRSFKALHARNIEEAGWDFLGRLDNMFTALAARPSTGESFKSWNKAGRAFDFYYRFPLSLDPQVEVVREEVGPRTYWRIYLRTAIQDGSQGEPMRDRPWDFTSRYGNDPSYYELGGKLKDVIPVGYYVDFTSLAADYNWQRVPAFQNWRSFFQGIRYWHFENRQGLTWEEAILEIYTEDELARVIGNP
jgi:TolB protein